MLSSYIKIGILVVAVAITGWNIHRNQHDVKLSEFALANVEALAAGENTCVICYGFVLKSYTNGCKICIQEGYGPCDIRDQVPC